LAVSGQLYAQTALPPGKLKTVRVKRKEGIKVRKKLTKLRNGNINETGRKLLSDNVRSVVAMTTWCRPATGYCHKQKDNRTRATASGMHCNFIL
jgi:hypothetical protein